jgi:hypothetical protein
MFLCGVGLIDLRLLSWRDGSLLILGVQPEQLHLDTGRRGMSLRFQVFGADLMFREDPVPSFMLMDLQGMSLVLYIYTLENGQIKVEKVFPSEYVLMGSCRIEKGRLHSWRWMNWTIDNCSIAV